MLKIISLIFLFFTFPAASQRRFQKPAGASSRSGATNKPPGIIKESQCSRIVDRAPHDRNFPSVYRLCVRLTQTQLMKKLRNEGTYNQRYMAVNRTDACRFKDLAVDGPPPPPQSSQFPNARQDQPLKIKLDSTEMTENDVNLFEAADTQHLHPGNENKRRQKRQISANSQIRGCWSRGSIVDGTGLKRLCTECAATTELSPGVFPPLINEMICHDTDKNCYRRIGRCAQRDITFTLLQRSDDFKRDDVISQQLGMDVYMEEWEEIEYRIRSCCECRTILF